MSFKNITFWLVGIWVYEIDMVDCKESLRIEQSLGSEDRWQPLFPLFTVTDSTEPRCLISEPCDCELCWPMNQMWAWLRKREFIITWWLGGVLAQEVTYKLSDNGISVAQVDLETLRSLDPRSTDSTSLEIEMKSGSRWQQMNSMKKTYLVAAFHSQIFHKR